MNNDINQYRPGDCNIGDDEVTKRKAELVISLLSLVVLTVLNFYFYESMILWLMLFGISSFTALMYFQVRNRFCVKFGWFKQYNFGKLGSARKITDPVQVARDRKKVIVLGLQTLACSILYTVLIYLLAENFHF